MRGYSVGQFWYLVAAEWWAAWGAHTGAACCRHPRAPPLDEAIVCDESFTTNSTGQCDTLLVLYSGASSVTQWRPRVG